MTRVCLLGRTLPFRFSRGLRFGPGGTGSKASTGTGAAADMRRLIRGISKGEKAGDWLGGEIPLGGASPGSGAAAGMSKLMRGISKGEKAGDWLQRGPPMGGWTTVSGAGAAFGTTICKFLVAGAVLAEGWRAKAGAGNWLGWG